MPGQGFAEETIWFARLYFRFFSRNFPKAIVDVFEFKLIDRERNAPLVVLNKTNDEERAQPGFQVIIVRHASVLAGQGKHDSRFVGVNYVFCYVRSESY